MNSGKRSNGKTLPPDVLFAQKATAIVKAAGMDPRSVDLERFRCSASIIFTRAYCAIFKEQLISTLSEQSSKEDKLLNVQLVIDGLLRKTRNPILDQIAAIDIYNGSHKAIGVLVGVLFAEGQRLWLEKVKTVTEQATEADSSALLHDDSQPQEGGALDAMGESLEEEQNGSIIGSESNADIEVHRNTQRMLEALRANPDITSKDLQRLLQRELQNDSQDEQGERPHRKKRSKRHGKRKQRIAGKRITEAILHSNDYHRSNSGKEQPMEEDDRLNLSADSMDEQALNEVSVSDKYSPGNRRLRQQNDDIDGRVGRLLNARHRPSSAPHTRRLRLTRRQQHVTDRLYGAALYRAESADSTPAGQPVQQDESEKKVVFDPSLHTYDWRTGRRILLSDARLEYEERRRKKEAMGKIIAISDMEVDGVIISPRSTEQDKDRPPSPTRPMYPTKRIHGDVRKWLQKMRRERYVPPDPPSPRKTAGEAPELEPLPEARYFAAYRKLELSDLIISVEHCCQCESHNVTTRHKERDYLDNSLFFLRFLAQVAHECGVCARVGVTRFPAHVTKHSKVTDHDSRIGAFEIQVAFRQPNGRVVPELLHSKLVQRRWPSKRVLEKRLRVFLAKVQVPLLPACAFADDSDLPAPETASDSTEPYPVGVCKWADSPLASAGWTFALTERRLSMQHVEHHGQNKFAKALESAQQAATAPPPPLSAAPPAAQLTNVQWAFDMREVTAPPPQFEVGTTIRVSYLEYAAGCVERHALLAFVKGYSDDPPTRDSELKVKPKYLQHELYVIPDCCCSLQDHVPPKPSRGSDGIPLELECVILLGQQMGHCSTWAVTPGEDRLDAATGDVLLSRSSFFKQMRALAWSIEQQLRRDGKADNALTAHPHVASAEGGELLLDMQLSYSEEVVSWCCDKFNGMANMTAIERIIAERKQLQSQDQGKRADSAITESAASSVEVENKAEVKEGVDGTQVSEKEEELSGTAMKAVEATVAQEISSEPIKETSPVAVAATSEESSAALAAPDTSEPAAIVKVEPPSVVGAEEPKVVSTSDKAPAEPVEAVPEDDQKTTEQEAASVPMPGETVAEGDASQKDEPKNVQPADETVLLEVPTDSAAGDTTVPVEADASKKADTASTPRTSDEPASKEVAAENGAHKQLQDTVDPAPSERTTPKDADVVQQVSVTEAPASSREEKQAEQQESACSPPTETAVKENSEQPPPELTEEEKEEEFRKSLVYQPKDMEFVSLIVEGEQLRHPYFDSVILSVTVDKRTWDAKVCLARERGSKRRSYHPSWGEFAVDKDILKEGFAYFSLVVEDIKMAKDHPELPTMAETIIGESPNSVKVPLYQLMESTFDRKVEVTVPELIGGKSTTVSISFLGHAREAKSQRAERIMSMKPEELINMKFDNILALDDDENLYSDDSDMEDDEERPRSFDKTDPAAGLKAQLFPQPSVKNLFTISSDTHGAGAAASPSIAPSA